MIRLVCLDALQLLRDRLAVGVLAAGLLASLIAALTGIAWQDRMERERATLATEAQAYVVGEREAWAEAQRADPAAAAVLPTRLVTTLQLAPPRLADFTVGRSAIEPTAAAVRLSTRPDAMFTRYQVENPERLARGALDLAFVAVVIAPLLLVGLGYGVFVGDRDSGTARLWLAQAGTPLRLIAVRSLNRLGLVAAPLLVGTVLLWLFGPPGREAAVLAWLGIALLGLLFWWAVVLLVNSLTIAAETAALVLVGLWALLVFVVPAAVAATAALVDPPPSRFEAIAAARATEVRASRTYDDDHPELSSSTLEGRRASVRKGIEVRRAVAEAVAPIQAETAARLEAQRAFAGRLALASPPMLTADALAGVAATDARSHAAQRRAAEAYLAPLGTALAGASLGRSTIDAATFDALPRFVPPPPPPIDARPILWLALVTLILGGLALMRLRRAPPL